MNTISVEMRTTDTRFPLGRDGRRVVSGTEDYRIVIRATGRVMVTFTFDQIPCDYPASVGCAPVEWIVDAA